MKITRDELLIAAFKLFMSVNYEKASFAELGKMLGMSKAGIFKYYKNKQELFSNNSEERLLASDDYQQQLAEAIYKGLRNYFLAHPMQSAPQGATAQTASTVTTPDRTLPN